MDADAEREARRAHRRATMRVRKTTLADEDELADYRELTPSERMEMIWSLTQSAWAFMGRDAEAESRLSRRTARVQRVRR
ncbi:hypothetical protein tb265_30930 [Gemmatimonadetes bacterium T265]|nr:hypothetical protein tb265_30930 [Gemmatimonadetes bacterium T265]